RARRAPRKAVSAVIGAGRAAIALGETQKARARFDGPAPLAREIDWPKGIALALHRTGQGRIDAGDYEDASSALEQALKIQEERQDKEAIASILRDLARAFEGRGDIEAAVERVTRARDLDE